MYTITINIIIFVDEVFAIKKRITYNFENRTWTLGNEAAGTLPKIFWTYPKDDRCVAKSTEENNQKWFYIRPDTNQREYHDIQIECLKNQQNSKCASETEFLCADKKQCVPESWRCDGIADCSDASDECPTLNDIQINIDNDIQSNPKLTVVGNVHIDKQLYNDVR